MGLFKSSKSSSKHATPSIAGSDKTSLNGSISKAASIQVKTINHRPSFVASMPNIPLPPPPDYATDPAGYLRSIYSVRERSQVVMELAKEKKLKHFDVDMNKFGETAQYVVSIIKVSLVRPLL